MEGDIRFRDGQGRPLFSLRDGECLILRSAKGETRKVRCLYLDEDTVHVEKLGDCNLQSFGIQVEKQGFTMLPKEPIYPEQCFAVHPDTGELLCIVPFQQRVTPVLSVALTTGDYEKNQRLCDRWNGHLGVSKAEQSAMLHGVLHGWDSQWANPGEYSADGNPRRKPQHSREPPRKNRPPKGPER